MLQQILVTLGTLIGLAILAVAFVLYKKTADPSERTEFSDMHDMMKK